jgi:hypothetical protein
MRNEKVKLYLREAWSVKRIRHCPLPTAYCPLPIHEKQSYTTNETLYNDHFVSHADRLQKR